MGADPLRPTVAEIDLGAIAHNVALLAGHVAPAQLWAVVKADGYGHGAVPVARTAVAAGAAGLAVALVAEAEQLRDAGIDAPLLVLSEPPTSTMARCAANGIEPTVCTAAGMAAAAAAGVGMVHVKVDTGMHRMGVGVEAVVALMRQADGLGVSVGSVWTHLACADEPANPFTVTQLERFAAVRDELSRAGVLPARWHAANSAGALVHPASHGSLVRAGISVYGLAPAPALAESCRGLQSALTLRSQVSAVRRVPAGHGVSYGQRFVAERDVTVATVPIGYADGVPRRFHERGRVLIGGRARPVTGVVTMDQLMVGCDDDAVQVGDEVVLIGRQGSAQITAADWAEWLGTITYEVTCAFGSRVPRRYREANR